ncbi:MAG: hypothetical protein J2P18_04000 [Nocardia sp.]|nr:hypothetical protein [Nocardia sp.]
MLTTSLARALLSGACAGALVLTLGTTPAGAGPNGSPQGIAALAPKLPPPVLAQLEAAQVARPTGTAAPTVPVDSRITEVNLPNRLSAPCGVEPGPDGALYINEMSAGKVGKYNPKDGSYREITVGPPAAAVGVPRLIDGNMWTTDGVGSGLITSSVVKVDVATGKTTEWSLGLRPGSSATDLTQGRDGRLYISNGGADTITEFDPHAGRVVATYLVPGALLGGSTIIQPGRGTALWTTSMLGNQIVKFDTATKQFTLYPIPTAGSVPPIAVPTPDGKVWFVELIGDKIGYLNPDTGAIKEFPLPAGSKSALDVEWNQQTGPDSAMIVADDVTGKIYQFDPNTEHWVREYPTPTPGSVPCAIGFQDGKAYVSELAGGNLAVIPDH